MRAKNLLLITFLLYSLLIRAEVVLKNASPQAEFARTALLASGVNCNIEMSIVADDEGIKAEGFRIKRDGKKIFVLARDAAGLMYGGLEVAELLKAGGLDLVKDDLQNPYMQMRGSKFNIPLDARTPSYSDPGDAAQFNIPEVWSMDFWKEYIDQMATNRYNFISLWNLHPFPSMVRVPGYEKVALDDVWRSRTIGENEHYRLIGVGFVTDEILKNPEIVKKMTMDDKIAFWRKVMAYGKSRNVEFYIMTWNIFTDATFGQYGITDDSSNKTTIDYFRKSVKEMFVTYPDLAGIGLTTGEHMPGGTEAEREEWALATYGMGVLDAAKEFPSREFRFIHRINVKNSPEEIIAPFKALVNQPNVDFILSFKYAKAHVYSATTQYYHQEFVEDLAPLKVKTIWTLRNDDTFYFRWGAPDFVREFVQNIPYDVSQGYYLGSDGWIWGREFLHRNVSGSRQIEIVKHDYQFMLWGRLGYDPTISNERFVLWLKNKYNLTLADAETLMKAWQASSMVYPEVTGFHWGDVDFKWYIEGCQSREEQANNETGFHDVNSFIELGTHPKADCQSIPDYARGKKSDKRTPLQIADSIEAFAKTAEELSGLLKPTADSELERTIVDIQIVAKMGHYYAHKIRGATELECYRVTKDKKYQGKAIEHLVAAARSWKAYTEQLLVHYKNPMWSSRVGIVDFKQNFEYALDDIRIAGGDPDSFDLPNKLDAENEPVVRIWEAQK